MRLRSSMLSDTILLTIVHILLRGISMAFQAFLSRKMGAEGLGLLQLVYNAGGFAMTLGLSGIRTATMYLCAEKFGQNRFCDLRSTLRSCLLYGLFFSVLASLLLFACSEYISAAFFKIDGAALPLRRFSYGIVFAVGIAVLSGYFTACKQIQKLIAVEIFDRLMSCGFTALFLALILNPSSIKAVTACIDAGTISALVSFIILSIMALKSLKPAHIGVAPKSELRKVISVSLPLALNDYLRSGLNSIEHFLIPIGLSRHLGSAQASLAEYGKLHGMVFPLVMFPAVVLQSLAELLVPELSRLSAQNQLIRTRQLVKKCVRLGFFYSAAVAYLLFTLSPQLVQIVYADPSLNALVRIFTPMVLVLYADSIVDAMCKGLGKHIQCVRINIFTSILDIAALYFLLPLYGLYGYIFTFALVHLVNFFLSIYLLFRTVCWTPNLLPMLKCIFCVLLCAALCLAVPRMLPQGIYCVLFSIVFFAAYVYFLTKLKVVRKTELSLMPFR